MTTTQTILQQHETPWRVQTRRGTETTYYCIHDARGGHVLGTQIVAEYETRALAVLRFIAETVNEMAKINAGADYGFARAALVARMHGDSLTGGAAV